MAMKRFVEAARRKEEEDYVEADRIPGTSKVRTYVNSSWLYSKESDLENIMRNPLTMSVDDAKKKIEPEK